MLEFSARLRRDGFTFDVEFEGPAQGVTVLFGPSGSGKSTALAVLAGALRAERSRIALSGRVLEDSAAAIRVPMEHRHIGWVLQDGLLFPHLTVAQNLDYGSLRARRRGPGAAQGAIARDRVIAVLGIGALLERRPRELSGGERQRVALGRALLSQPALLLLDEPLAALDAARRLEILAFIDEVKREFRVPMVYVTHSLAEVVRLADRLVLLESGSVVAAGPAASLIGNPDIALLAGRGDAGVLLEAAVLGRDTQRGYALVALGAQRLAVPDPGLAAGARVRLYVQSSDVMLAAERPGRISVRNVLHCRVTRIAPQRDTTVLVELDPGEGRLLASITREALEELGLAPGASVYALIKSVAIDAPAGRMLIEAGG